MEYSINELAKMSGISTRTLRYYDTIDLLKPKRISKAGYRVYGAKEVDNLQEILVLKTLGFSLEEIAKLISAGNYDRKTMFETQLTNLKEKKGQIEAMIRNMEQSIKVMKGEGKMTDKEKFTGLKKAQIAENESKYGTELREHFGNETIDASNAKVMNMSEESYENAGELENRIKEVLKLALLEGDPKSEHSAHLFSLHKQWLCLYWDTYHPQMHIGLGEMYVGDPRFASYYEEIAPGAAQFLRDVILEHCSV